MNKTTALGCDARQPKHLSLDAAISRLRDIRERAQDLLHRIQGSIPRDSTTKAEPPMSSVIASQPSLCELLEDGPDRLNGLYDDLNDTLHRIEEVLF